MKMEIEVIPTDADHGFVMLTMHLLGAEKTVMLETEPGQRLLDFMTEFISEHAT